MTEWCSFEKSFFSKAYFSGEHQLDTSLYSLIHLDESTQVLDLPDGRQFLFDENRLRLKMRTMNDRVLKEKYRSISKRTDFDPLEFIVKNNLPLDKITGCFPMVFDNYRLVSHSLRMAWAFFLTLRMKKLDKRRFLQRYAGGSWKACSKNLLTILFIHIHTNLKRMKSENGLPAGEKEWIKCLKNSLCFHVSLAMDQKELPEGQRFDMIPPNLKEIFQCLSSEERINFFFSLLQSKSLCKEVPESFILDTLIKHREQLSSPSLPLEPSIVEDLRERGRRFGKIVKRFYDPDHGFSPSNKATFEFPQNRGGQKGDLVYNNRLKNRSNCTDRAEPFVIGLFGQPGQGKSTRLNSILSKLAPLFPGVKRSDLTYSRSCHVEHWDGYRNQPIVILDDIGQSLEGKDIKEFQTLVSCSPYIPPMASLEEKGIPFTSEIIILTSNLLYGTILQYHYQDSNGILDDASFWRRIHVPYYVESGQLYELKEKPSWVRERNLICRPGLTRKVNDVKFLNRSRFFQEVPDFRVSQTNTTLIQDKWKLCDSTSLASLPKIFKERARFHKNISSTWIQKVVDRVETPETLVSREFFQDQIACHLPTSLGFDCCPELDSQTHILEFDAYPPEGPLPVRVEPIVEPLKVRTITAGKGETFCLKPLQRAMWHALGEEEQFCLTHGTNNLDSSIQRIWESSQPSDVWISGDYTAATDSFPIEATKALMEGILESIDHEPTKRWAMKEISPHLLVYPPDSGLEPALQESGQLMGSLLSFPLLCLLNDCTALSIGLQPHQYLINGDDILMRTAESNYPLWKEKVKKFGLSLSLGKNYVHPLFGTVNSQLVMGGTVLDSGKQKVLDRRTQVLGECLRDLEVMMGSTGAPEVHELFKAVNRSKLSRTCRSISVPSSHGGLSFSWGNRSGIDIRTKRTEILVYLNDLFKKVTPEEGCIAVPYLSHSAFRSQKLEEQDRCFNEPVSSKEYHEDFISVASLDRVRKRLMSNSHLRDLFLGQNLEDLPSLSYLKVLQIPFNDVRVRKKIQKAIDEKFYINYLDSNRDFGYESFRSDFLHAVRGVPNEATERSTKFLTPIIDLEVRPDYLLKVASSYTCKRFDSELFEKSLGKALAPKQFNLPILPDSPDFSKEVCDSFDHLLSQISEDPGSIEIPVMAFEDHFLGFPEGNIEQCKE